MRKKIRTRGKLQLSRYFQELEKGDSVSIVRESAVHSNLPKRMQGKIGLVEKKRGRAYIVRIMDINKEKRFIINPIHLKKIDTIKKQ